MCWMLPVFGTLSRRTSPYTSYPLLNRSSIRYEPSWPVAPVTRADFAIGLEVRHHRLTVSPFARAVTHLRCLRGDEGAHLLQENGFVECPGPRDAGAFHGMKGRIVELTDFFDESGRVGRQQEAGLAGNEGLAGSSLVRCEDALARGHRPHRRDAEGLVHPGR